MTGNQDIDGWAPGNQETNGHQEFRGWGPGKQWLGFMKSIGNQ